MHQIQFLERGRAVCLCHLLAGSRSVGAGTLPSPRRRRPSRGPFSSVASTAPGSALPMGHAQCPGPAAHEAGKGTKQHAWPRSRPSGDAGCGGRRQAHSCPEPIGTPGFCHGLESVPAAPRLRSPPPRAGRTPGVQTGATGATSVQLQGRSCARPRRDCASPFLRREEALPRGAGCGSCRRGLGDRTAAYTVEQPLAQAGPAALGPLGAPRWRVQKCGGGAGVRPRPPGAPCSDLRVSTSRPPFTRH